MFDEHHIIKDREGKWWRGSRLHQLTIRQITSLERSMITLVAMIVYFSLCSIILLASV